MLKRDIIKILIRISTFFFTCQINFFSNYRIVLGIRFLNLIVTSSLNGPSEEYRNKNKDRQFVLNRANN